ncbi:hypothetical protein MJO28_004262 [Puccinia striiformis f. sp. tritici]|uniref:Uncharacterized protein n=3 Tax=Puccinia striiformis TaxID=27350 RepID=A0A0L0V4Y6_9BASI|nr:hypothetical protein Pst134EA_007142 [Puccinia striiformis f. sp. tritici]KAI9608539.1 hypothetical protein H4Q26_004722 [Puccinia striiformis f. sp. tritici PST-130]KNE94029.1 hypothetical protein PSTG_12605 [Puccinia striiformis f. sp. tritici PST-78]POW06949.1 hypothetical protein PSTT_08633 [Puccinia striiformis]KAH9469866.1 hypothetical protein Pst134EA_007142 [Puccinia striiformis f. sp. tritici]KAI7957167.1 hypothetical protein MJO28_004262 [Puccinia striiformis f. sp. tritici]
MRTPFRCVLMLWAVRLARPGRTPIELLTETLPEFGSDRYRTTSGGVVEPSTELSLSLANPHRSFQPATSARPKEIDFLGAWEKDVDRGGEPHRIPFWMLGPSAPAADQEDTNELIDRSKRVKYQSNQRTPSPELVSGFHQNAHDSSDKTHRDSSNHPELEHGNQDDSHSGSRIICLPSDSTVNSAGGIQIASGAAPRQGDRISTRLSDTEQDAASSKLIENPGPGKSSVADGYRSNQATEAKARDLLLVKGRASLEDIDPPLWAFIYSMKLDISDPLWQEITSEHEATISSFITSLSSHLDPLRTQTELYSSAQEFAHLLWCVNSKFLRTFRPSDKAYLQEQLDVQYWITRLFADSATSQGISITEGHRKPTSSENAKNGLAKLIAAALASRKLRPEYELLTSFVDQPSANVCPKQILMAKAVVHVLASYYKNENLSKWGVFFSKDNKFIEALAAIQNWGDTYYSYVSKKRKALDEELDAHAFFPWKDPIPVDSVFNQHKTVGPFFGPVQLQMRSRVQRIKRTSLEESSSSKNTKKKFQSRNKQLMEENPDKIWSFISMLALDHDKHIMGRIRQPKIRETLEACRLYIARLILNPTNQINLHITTSTRENLEDLKKMLDLLWFINSRLIENLGQDIYGKVFFEEQANLQKEFYAIFTSPDDALSEFDSHSFNAKGRVPTKNMIIKALNCNDHKPIYSHKDRMYRISRKEIMITEAVVEVMISYYWNSNPTKWGQVFQDKELFVLNLTQIETRLIKKRYFDNHQEEYHDKLKELGLLPWKNCFIRRAKHRVMIKRAFQLHSHSVVSSKIVEEV